MAHGVKQLHAQHHHADFNPSVQLMTGRYEFEARPAANAWVFHRLKLHIGWEEGNRKLIDYAYGVAGD